ncbi:MAG TPA: PTS fructose transporter subunit IIA [Gammaproteobacteria bacterium]|nr:PTS fructose transporter subunit IIA [Gammaproteobacteria bacterium]
MSVGLLLITHENIASSLLETARTMLNASPLATRALEIPLDYPVDKVLTQARSYMETLDTGNGVLIISDIFGATPFNIARQLCADYNCKLVVGINLPMMVRILNYPQLNLENMALKAVTGGHDGISLCECQDPQPVVTTRTQIKENDEHN